ncbi:MAG: hypothetical protein ACRBCK_12040 [Alphaproteobacteria bacterium]
MLEEHQDGNEDFKNAITTMASLASRAPDMLNSSKTGVKRALIAFVFSNLQLNGTKLEYTLREPFQSFQSVGECNKWHPVIDTVRTQNSHGIIKLHKQISPELLEAIEVLSISSNPRTE